MIFNTFISTVLAIDVLMSLGILVSLKCLIETDKEVTKKAAVFLAIILANLIAIFGGMV